MTYSPKFAFSLVELSIVLVILGLLTGGILAGQSLIRAAELRAVSTEYQRYMTAMQSFRDKYFALPGDMINATKFWGTDAGCPGVYPTVRTGIPTCDGDGDGIILHVSAGGTKQNELYGLWQHLSNAGLIEGKYAGISTGAFGWPVPYDAGARAGFNVPGSKLPNAAWGFITTGNIDISNTGYVEGQYGNALYFGGSDSGGLLFPTFSASGPLKADEAWNIDTKMDDGKPGSGSVVLQESNTSCYLLSNGSAGVTSAAAARTDIQYNLPNASSSGCSFVFKTQF